MREPNSTNRKDGTIDAALVILDRVREPGQTLTQEEIADVCGCSKGYIWYLEKTAKRKLKIRFAKLRKEGKI